jgi:hypothetical protein
MSDLENAALPQQDVAPPQPEAQEVKAPSEEARIEALVMVLEPGDHAHLASLIRQHPGLRDAIITLAAQYVGNETVVKALEVLDGPAPAAAVEAAPQANAVAPVAETAAEKPADFDWLLSPLALEGNFEGRVQEHVDFIHAHPGLREAVLAGCAEYEPDLARAVREALAAPPVAPDVETPAPTAQVQEDVAELSEAETEEHAPAPKKKEIPGWVLRARAYNQAHAALVAEFNELTGYACVGPMDWIEGESVEELEVDPYLVAQWQQDAGLAPDGRVGPKTVDAAKVELEPMVADAAEVESEEPPAG